MIESVARRRRRSVVATTLVASLAVSLLLGACGGSSTADGATGSTPSPSASVSSSSSTATPTTTTAAVPVRPLPLAAVEVFDLVDRTRPTVRDGSVIDPVRHLPTTIWRPAGSGAHPLVVFAHGYGVGPDGYARFCRELASKGYVVAAPSFPLADEARGNGLRREDIPEEASDVAFVADALRTGSLAARIAEGPYAAAGHSDGADVVLLVGYGAGRSDADVGAIIAMSPDAMTGGIITNAIPMLLTHGTADATVPYAESRTVDAQVLAPHWFLTLEGADHLPPVADDTPWTPVLDAAVTAFLDATVGGFHDEIATLRSELDALPRSSVTERN